MCLYPRLIINPKYKANKKNNWNPPRVKDPRVIWVPIGCKNCIECRKQDANGWRIRLMEDIRVNKNAKFIALTFSDESIAEIHAKIKGGNGYETDNEIATYAVRHFLERHRDKHKKSIRHFLITELGHRGTKNIHLHGLLWTDINLNEIEKTWKYGWMFKGNWSEQTQSYKNYVNESSINYIIKYITKKDDEHKTFKARILCTAGIGKNYTERNDSKRNQYKTTGTNETYRTRTGHKIGIPIYWRNKIYTDQQKEELWLQRLDKQERWICGEKVDISKTDKSYTELLEWYRIKNQKLGYGDNKPNWKLKEYEAQMRNLRTQYRINKTANNDPETGAAS